MGKRRQRSEGEPSIEHPNGNEAHLASEQRRTRSRVTRASAHEAALSELNDAPAQPAVPEPNADPAQQQIQESNAHTNVAAVPERPEEEIHSDLTCALCQDLFVDPVIASPVCGHAFCRLCHLRLFHIRLPSEPGIPPAQRTRPCPLCRQKSAYADATPASDLSSRAKAAHPELYTRRLIEATIARQQLEEREPLYFSMRVGNTTEYNSIRTRSGESSRHEWEFFVELRDPITGNEIDATYIEEVAMHVTTGASQEVRTTSPYTIHRAGVSRERHMCYSVITFKPETRLAPVAVTWLVNMSPGRHFLDCPLELIRRPMEGGAEDDNHVQFETNVTTLRAAVVSDSNEQAAQDLGETDLFPMLADLVRMFVGMERFRREVG